MIRIGVLVAFAAGWLIAPDASAMDGRESLTDDDVAEADEPVNFLVVRAHVLSRVLSQRPPSEPGQSGMVVTLLSCGEESVHLHVDEVLLGRYDGAEIAATLNLSQWCDSLVQPSIVEYVFVLDWYHQHWQMWHSLSSPLVEQGGKKWFVEPYSIRNWQLRGFSPPTPLEIPLRDRQQWSIERTRSLGHDVTPAQLEADLGKCGYGECWYLAPMQYTQGYELKEFVHLLHEHPQTVRYPCYGPDDKQAPCL